MRRWHGDTIGDVIVGSVLCHLMSDVMIYDLMGHVFSFVSGDETEAHGKGFALRSNG